MKEELVNKLQECFGQMIVYKDLSKSLAIIASLDLSLS